MNRNWPCTSHPTAGDESIENGWELVTVIKYCTLITDPRVLKEGEFRGNINNLTPLDEEVTHNNQGEGEIVNLKIRTQKFRKNCLNEYLLTHFTLK